MKTLTTIASTITSPITHMFGSGSVKNTKPQANQGMLEISAISINDDIHFTHVEYLRNDS